MSRENIKYDVALSFAGEERAYVEKVAYSLRNQGVRTFYDAFDEVDLWGKDLYAHLVDVYQNQAKFVVLFISSAYEKKLWTNHERRAAQARAFQESQEYILPTRFDDTAIPGVLPTVGYIDLNTRSPNELAELIIKKLISNGGTIPSEHVRGDFSTLAYVPRFSSTTCRVKVLDDLGNAINGAHVVALAQNNTFLEGHSDIHGYCTIELKTNRLYTLLVAHPEFPCSIGEAANLDNDVCVTLPTTDNLGSVIIHSTGHIPGINGRLNPILDTSFRTYLYADNVAIDEGKQQPARFSVGVPLKLEDADGTMTYVTIKHIAGRTSLLQFLRVPGSV